MSRLPYMKFYKAEWRAESTLKLCSWDARYLWLEMLLIMDESPERGFLKIGKTALDESQLANVLGLDPARVKDCVSELEKNEVFSRTKGHIIYSRRMVREEKKARIARENGKLGGNPSLCNQLEIPLSDNQTVVDLLESTLKKDSTDRDLKTPESPSRKGDFSEAGKKLPETLPDWLPLDAWAAYLEMRKKIRKPPTARAVELAIALLEKFRAEGHDPKDVLEQSVLNSWQGLFQPKENKNGKNDSHHKPKTSYLDKIANAGKQAKAIIDARMDADRNAPWNNEEPATTGGHSRDLPKK